MLYLPPSTSRLIRAQGVLVTDDEIGRLVGFVSAQSSLDATQAGFEVGTRTIVEVLQIQEQLFQAQSAYSQARHQFVLSGLQLKEAAGTISGKDIEAVNALLE